jgi:hypothetical protein
MASSPILEAALQYIGRGWPVLPLWGVKDGICRCSKGAACDSPGKHPCIKAGPDFSNASLDPAQIEKWFGGKRGFVRNLGGKTGGELVLVDIDGAKGMATLAPLVEANEPLSKTLMAESGRADGGRHAFYRVEGASPTNSGGGLDIRGDKGLVVLPPSLHASGKRYRWLNKEPIAPMQGWLLDWFWNREDGAKGQAAGPDSRPEYLRSCALPRLAERAADGMHELAEPDDLAAVIALIPNPGLGYEAWNVKGLNIHAASGGAEYGRIEWHNYSAKCREKYDEEYTEKRWNHYHKHPSQRLHFGNLIWQAREVDPDFELPSLRPKQEEKELVRQHDAADETELNGHVFPFDEEVNDPKALIILNEFNKRFSVISDIGGKCLVLHWIPSKAETGVLIPSFQTFKAFAERFMHQYIKISVKKDDEIEEKTVQAGSYWLKWRRRKTYEGIDLVPDIENLPKGYLNMWRGFAVEPRAGSWRLMQRHIIEVLAGDDRESAEYIFRFAAWAVQHPGERAEVALVFRGGKGSGKGTFANALRRLFGAHGLQIFNSKHLVGAFNGHLRNCLLLFSDEAFWAGDKPGESVLKGLLTERTVVIEQKGIDAVPWRNRLKVVMSANNDWVVPASHDERRYAVFQVSPHKINDTVYFQALHAEINAGGVAAMLADLQSIDLKEWHPRLIVRTAALREQKLRSLDYKHEWWEGVLQSGLLPGTPDTTGAIPAMTIYDRARTDVPRLRDASLTALGRFLRDMGGEGFHRKMGNYWRFPDLIEARKVWENKFGIWDWRNQMTAWDQQIEETPHNPSPPFTLTD